MPGSSSAVSDERLINDDRRTSYLGELAESSELREAVDPEAFEFPKEQNKVSTQLSHLVICVMIRLSESFPRDADACARKMAHLRERQLYRYDQFKQGQQPVNRAVLLPDSSGLNRNNLRNADQLQSIKNDASRSIVFVGNGMDGLTTDITSIIASQRLSSACFILQSCGMVQASRDRDFRR